MQLLQVCVQQSSCGRRPCADVDDDDFKMEASNVLALKDSLADALIFDWEAVDDAAWQRVAEQMEIVMAATPPMGTSITWWARTMLS